MIHLTHPRTREYLRKWQPNGHFETTPEAVKAANLYPEDISRIRNTTGVEWVATPIAPPVPEKAERT